jgi:hypothetical protein
MHEKDKEKPGEIEGTGKGYHDSTIDVPGFGICLTYLGATSHICTALKPYDWYKEIVLLGCRKLDLPDRKRSREQWQTVERLRRDTYKISRRTTTG